MFCFCNCEHCGNKLKMQKLINKVKNSNLEIRENENGNFKLRSFTDLWGYEVNVTSTKVISNEVINVFLKV